eukprot:1160453-Pelagomonas_calceolata.AAC.6
MQILHSSQSCRKACAFVLRCKSGSMEVKAAMALGCACEQASTAGSAGGAEASRLCCMRVHKLTISSNNTRISLQFQGTTRA